jgi:DNA uptake protein ComE-like DNA-binding protein
MSMTRSLTCAGAFFLLFALPAAAQTHGKHGSKHADTTATAQSPAAPKPVPPLVDINTASRQELVALHIGGRYADRIIKGRPYHGKNELTTKGILPAGAYNRIKDRITAKQPEQ